MINNTNSSSHTHSTRYHLTTAIPYVNAKPHLGHVLEWFQADAIARYQRQLGKQVSFTSGADENSLKNVQAAQKEGMDTQAFLDTYSQLFEKAYQDFDISLTGFRRGSDSKLHWPGVQQLWNLCKKNDDIYKKTYQGLYCVGCESFYTENDLQDGYCPEHPGSKPELITEENYFFKLSKYQKTITELIESDTLLIVSNQYKQEMLGFIQQGLEDFSISRSIERARGVGVPVPDDDSQRMYVWFDALTLYMTAIGWGYDQDKWQDFWPANVHVIGKGINRFHSVYWIGMLLSANLPLPKAISVHGYITANGQKMSKSIGNVIDPYEVVEKYGLEPIRYYLLKYIPTHSDGDFSTQAFKELYTADLANGIGNACSRVAAMVAKQLKQNDENSKHLSELLLESTDHSRSKLQFDESFMKNMDAFSLHDAVSQVLKKVESLDKYLSDQKPWLLTEPADQQRKNVILVNAVNQIMNFAYHLAPFMPKTSQTILKHFTKAPITPLPALFPRLEQ